MHEIPPDVQSDGGKLEPEAENKAEKRAETAHPKTPQREQWKRCAQMDGRM